MSLSHNHKPPCTSVISKAGLLPPQNTSDKKNSKLKKDDSRLQPLISLNKFSDIFFYLKGLVYLRNLDVFLMDLGAGDCFPNQKSTKQLE